MNIIVCCKQVIDPEAPPPSFKLDTANDTLTLPPGVSPVLDPYSEYAVEAALRIKETSGAKITVLSLGNDLIRDVVKKPLAIGVDELILLEDEAFIGGDSWTTAYALAAAIKKIGSYDLILCGRQASDWDSGQVGIGIADILGLPIVTIARKVQVSDGKVQVERVVGNGYEVIEAVLPMVVTISNEIGEVRYPNIKGIMAAKKKEPIVWKPADIEVAMGEIGKEGRRLKLVKLFQPLQESNCEIVTGETPEDAGVKLAQRLRDDEIL